MVAAPVPLPRGAAVCWHGGGIRFGLGGHTREQEGGDPARWSVAVARQRRASGRGFPQTRRQKQNHQGFSQLLVTAARNVPSGGAGA